jgi:hypothetical protein
MALSHIATPPEVRDGDFTATVRFRFNGPAGNGSNQSSWLYFGVSDIVDDSYFFGHTSPFVEIDFNNGAQVGDGQMGLWGGDALEDPNWNGDFVFIPTEQDVVTFTSGTWYVLKYHFVPGILHESKIWRDGDPEPEYQISDELDYRWGITPGEPGSGAIHGDYFWIDLRGFGGRAEIDNISVDSNRRCEAYGVQHAWQPQDAGGDNSGTHWTEFPYIPGSVAVTGPDISSWIETSPQGRQVSLMFGGGGGGDIVCYTVNPGNG